MELNSKNSSKKREELYIWCLEQASLRYTGELSQDKIDKLDSIGFPWAMYENELDLDLLNNKKKSNNKKYRE